MRRRRTSGQIALLRRDLSLREIADPTHRGLRQPEKGENVFSTEQSENVYENKGSQFLMAPQPGL
ncbi:hypothetical protein SBA2_180010 [Acidobacteriia bacterium SbA2]|nr:hypothetical protein SBA2_180010 [Acidobacteriia bacterium SbA2]